MKQHIVRAHTPATPRHQGATRPYRSLSPLAVAQALVMLWGSFAFALDMRVTRTQWVGVEGRAPVDLPSDARLMAEPDVVDSFTLDFPGLGLAEIESDEGRFTWLSMPGTGVSAVPGAPELPVYRRQVLVDPAGAYSCRATVLEQETYDLAKLETPRILLPARRAVPKLPGAKEAATLGLDAGQYGRATGPEHVASLLDLGLMDGRKLLLVELFPVTYDPTAGRVTHRKRIAVEIVRTGVNATNAVDAKIQAVDISLGNLPRGETKGASSKRLLIVASDPFVTSLAGFAAHKRNMGWEVDIVGTSEAGSGGEAIRGHIRARYLREDLCPSHLLLVGDSDTIPAWPGQGAYTPDTDLYYACMDGADDWLPDMAYGRFPARSPTQLSNMVGRVIHYETQVSNALPFVSRAAFAASSDNHSVTEGTHNAVISRHMVPRSYSSDSLYSYTHGATKAQVVAALNAGRGLMTYSGHAYAHMWRDPAMEVADVHSLTNAFLCPLVLSFACDSGSFATLDESFAEAWMRAGANAGAVAVFASSEDSYWEEDDILEKGLFASMFEEGERRLGNAVLRAKQRYLAHYGPGSETLQYFEQYNLLGDPTLLLAVLEGESIGDLVAAARDLPDRCLKTNEVFDVTVQVQIGNPAPTALILKEKLPPGWTVSNARWNGAPMAPSFASGEYKWLFGVGTPVGSGTLTYSSRADGQTGDVYTISGALLHGATTVDSLGDQEVRICAVIDTDEDGMPDDWEIFHGLSPSNAADAGQHGDSDGLSNLEEYLADTNPTNALSRLALTEIAASGTTTRVSWAGGRAAAQYLERSPHPGAPADAWQVVHIATPPTLSSNAFTHATGTNGVHIYRIRAVR
jgi:hypothetical protein